MKSNDKLIAIAIGSILVVGAFMVGILVGLPDSGGSSVRAQESATPPPKPPPTGEDFDRWEREWAAKNNEGLEIFTIEIDPPDQVAGQASGFVGDATNGWRLASETFTLSQPGDRVLKFWDGSTKTLPEGVELTEVLLVISERLLGEPEFGPHIYVLKKGDDVLEVDFKGRVSEWMLNTVSDPSAFSFLTSED